MEIIAIIGKVLFGALFLDAGRSHFQYKDVNVVYARSKGMPLAELGVVVSGLVLIVAPILFILGIWEMAALISLAVFLFLTCILFHNYWQINDPNAKQMDRISFFKNLSLLGMVLVLITTL